MNNEVINLVKLALIGDKCGRVENLGSYLQVYFEKSLLIIQTDWQLSEQGRLILATTSDENLLDTISNILSGKVINDITITGIYHDLVIEFNESLRLETNAIKDSAEFEHWQLSLLTEANELLISGPGSLWSFFK